MIPHESCAHCKVILTWKTESGHFIDFTGHTMKFCRNEVLILLHDTREALRNTQAALKQAHENVDYWRERYAEIA